MGEQKLKGYIVDVLGYENAGDHLVKLTFTINSLDPKDVKKQALAKAKKAGLSDCEAYLNSLVYDDGHGGEIIL